MDQYEKQNLPADEAARLAREAVMIQEALDEADAFGTIPMEEAFAWARSIGTDHELPMPELRKT